MVTMEEVHPQQTVLVVDDYKAICALVKIALKRIKIECTLVHSCEEALHAAGDRVPDLILCDLKLPGLDGLQTLATIRALPQVKDVPAILMGGLLEGSAAEQLDRLGVCQVLHKPFALDHLISEVKKCLETCRIS
jgi:CheY-like chemotaxis protein